MSVVISFASGADWYKANWVFRQLANDVARLYPDADITNTLEKAQAVNHLDFTAMESRFSAKLMSPLRAVAHGTVQGSIEGWRPEDHKGHEMYRDAMSELIAMIDEQVQQSEP